MMRFLAVLFVLALCMFDVARLAQTTLSAVLIGVCLPAALAALFAIATRKGP